MTKTNPEPPGTDSRGTRTLRPDGWCCRWQWCKVIDGACYEGGGRALLCRACDAEADAQERAAAISDGPQEVPA